MKKKIFIIGGHFSPAKAVIDELLARGGFEIYYLGRKYAMEDDRALALEFVELSKSQDIVYCVLQTGRLQRKFFVNFWQSVRSLAKIPLGFIQAFYYILRYRPAVVLSFGGYVAIPVVFAAWIVGIKIVIHEQTLVAGVANRIMSFLADRVLVSWKESAKFFPKAKTVLVGNPVRLAILQVKRRATKGRKVIYITGGNQGSHLINQAVFSLLPKLLDKYEVIHQTGDSKFGDFDRLMTAAGRLRRQLKGRYLLRKFVDEKEIGRIFGRADLVVGRPGANLVTEVLYLGIKAVLIPISWAESSEQEMNARFLCNLGQASIVSEKGLTDKILMEVIASQMATRDAIEDNEMRVLISGAAGRIADELENVNNNDAS